MFNVDARSAADQANILPLKASAPPREPDKRLKAKDFPWNLPIKSTKSLYNTRRLSIHLDALLLGTYIYYKRYCWLYMDSNLFWTPVAHKQYFCLAKP